MVIQLEKESVYESAFMSGIMRRCVQDGIGIVASTNPPKSPYATTGPKTISSTTELAPCIRMTVSALHTKEDTDKAIKTLIESAALMNSRYPMHDDAIVAPA